MHAFYVAFAALVRIIQQSKFLVVPAAIFGAWIMLTAYIYASVAPLQGSIYKVLSRSSPACVDCSHPISVAWEANDMQVEEARTSQAVR